MNQELIVTRLVLKDGYKFIAEFDEDSVSPLLMDEPIPLGAGTGPSASRVLAAAVGNCLSASALFCLRKAHVEVRGMRTEVVTRLGRNDQGRMRIVGIDVHIWADVPEEQHSRMSRCLELFEDFCVVTESVRHGIPVEVTVETTAPVA